MTKYDLESVALPRLSGRALQAFAAAMANPAGRGLLLGRLLAQGGITRLRQLRLDEPPTFYPLLPAEAPGGALDLAALADQTAEPPQPVPAPPSS